MSNQAKIVQRVLGEELEKFEADNLCLRMAEVNRMGGQFGHRSEFTEWFDVPYISTTVDGINIANFNQITGLAVPHRVNIYANVPFTLDNTDTLDGSELSRKMRSAMQAIDNRINRAVANAVTIQGAQFVRQDGASGADLTGFDDVASVETLLVSQDVSQMTQKTMVLNPRDYNDMASDLQIASRTLQPGSISETAYERARIAMIANFDTFKTSFTPNLAAGAAGATTVDTTQSYVPVGHTLDANGDPTNVDNRSMLLTVNSNTDWAPGDKFTIAGVNAVSLQNKEDTGELRTFTVIDTVGATQLQISPPIIPVVTNPNSEATQAQADYANCTVAAPDTAALTILNTASGLVNPFWENEAIAINVAPVVGPENDVGGMIIMNETTDLGLNVVVAKQGAINDLSTQWRVSTFFGVTVRDPLKCGILMGRQTF